MTKRIALLLGAMATAILSLSVAFFAAETTVAAETTTYLTSIADASILENAPNTNYGAAATLGADGDRPSGSGKDRYGLLRWDLGGIAPGTRISSASVTLSVTNSSPQTYEAYALKRAWVESEVTWNRYAAGKPWEVAGAKGPLDREATVAGTVTPSATGERTFALSAALVQRWVDDPATNHGIIVANATNSDEFEFYSRESATSNQSPRLNVNYEGVDSAPPETTIDSGPSDIFSDASASFTFSSNEVNSAFECRLDGVTFSSCTSPKSYTGLSEGSHTFEVRATDAAGNTDLIPASRSWNVATSRTASVTSSADTHILENAPKRNYGTVASLGANGDQPAGTGKDQSALLKWDLSTIPAGSKISSASVTLNVTNSSAQTYQAYELKRPWVQSAATWQLYAAGNHWQIAGAKGSLDRGTTVVSTVSPSSTGKQTFALSPAVVQSWVDNPASNKGITIANATNTDGVSFSSRESTTSNLRPQLNVTYEVP